MQKKLKNSAPRTMNFNLFEIHMLSTQSVLWVCSYIPETLFIAGKTRTKFGVYSWTSVVVF